MHDSRGIEIVNLTISLALSAGTLMASAGTPYRLVPAAHFYPCSSLIYLPSTCLGTAAVREAATAAAAAAGPCRLTFTPGEVGENRKERVRKTEGGKRRKGRDHPPNILA